MKHTKLVLLCLFEWDFDGKNIVTLYYVKIERLKFFVLEGSLIVKK